MYMRQRYLSGARNTLLSPSTGIASGRSTGSANNVRCSIFTGRPRDLSKSASVGTGKVASISRSWRDKMGTTNMTLQEQAEIVAEILPGYTLDENGKVVEANKVIDNDDKD